MDTITTIGLDIAKSSFSARCAAASGKRVKRVSLTAQKSSRAVIISTLTNHIAGGRPRTRV